MAVPLSALIHFLVRVYKMAKGFEISMAFSNSRKTTKGMIVAKGVLRLGANNLHHCPRQKINKRNEWICTLMHEVHWVVGGK